MGEVCSRYESCEEGIPGFEERSRRADNLEDVGVDGRIILTWI
jgi:hypothetical protein